MISVSLVKGFSDKWLTTFAFNSSTILWKPHDFPSYLTWVVRLFLRISSCFDGILNRSWTLHDTAIMMSWNSRMSWAHKERTDETVKTMSSAGSTSHAVHARVLTRPDWSMISSVKILNGDHERLMHSSILRVQVKTMAGQHNVGCDKRLAEKLLKCRYTKQLVSWFSRYDKPSLHNKISEENWPWATLCRILVYLSKSEKGIQLQRPRGFWSWALCISLSFRVLSLVGDVILTHRVHSVNSGEGLEI
jgi:hypothetical protein